MSASRHKDMKCQEKASDIHVEGLSLSISVVG